MKKTGGFFGLSPSYIQYKIITKPHNWEVRRKEADFLFLREILEKLYPYKIVLIIQNINKYLFFLIKFI